MSHRLASSLALIGLSAVLALTGSLRAQSFYYPENDPADSYVDVGGSSPFTPHCLHDYRLYLPPASAGDRPESGWPVLIHLNLSFFINTTDITQIGVNSFMGQCLTNGIAVITARATTSNINPAPCGGITGLGLFHPPGVVADNLSGAGTMPYNDPEFHMPEKDAVMLIQHVRHHAGECGHDLADLDPHRVAVYSVSAGAIALMWPTLGPDRSSDPPFAGVGGQYAESSRPDAAIFSQGAVWWPIFDATLNAPHFGNDTNHSDACDATSGNTNAIAANIGAADRGDLIAASALAYEDAVLNDELPLMLIYADPGTCRSYVKDSSPPFSCDPFWFQEPDPDMPCSPSDCQDGTTGLGEEDELHPAWSGYAWKAAHPGDNTRLIITNDITFDDMCGAPAEEWLSSSALIAEMVDFIQDAFASPWHVIHNFVDGSDVCRMAGVAGVDGIPLLTGSGTLVANEDITLTLTKTVPNGTDVATLLVSVDLLNASFKGGYMVPEPDILLTGFDTTSAGECVVESTWPSGVPSGTKTYYQFWVEDAAAPQDYSGSTGLMGEAP